jgi:hypothetical protein
MGYLMRDYRQPVAGTTVHEEWTIRYVDPQGEAHYSGPMHWTVAERRVLLPSESIVKRTVTVTPWADDA